MKSKLILTVLAVVAISLGTMAGDAGLPIDTEASTVAWKAKKVGGAHEGLISLASGGLTFNGHDLTGGSFAVDMQSIQVTDIEDEGKNGKLVGHLNSPDFFNTEEFTKATFKITNVESKGHHVFQVTGDMTIKGITAPVEFETTLSHEGKATVAKADIEIDRTVYDVRYGSKKFFDDLGDKFIYDTFTLSVVLKTKSFTLPKSN